MRHHRSVADRITRGDQLGWFTAGDGKAPRSLAIPPDVTPVWEPDGPRYAFLRLTPFFAGDSVFVGSADSIWSYPIGGAGMALSWLPRAEGLLVLVMAGSGSSSLVKVELPTGRTSVLVDSLDAPAGPPPPFALAPDGQRVVIALAGLGAPDPEVRNLPQARRRLGIYEVDLATGRRRPIVPPTEYSDAFAPSIGGENLFWTTTESSVSIVVLPAAGGSAREVVSGAFLPTWQPDGRRIGFAYGEWRMADWPLNWDGGAIEVDGAGRPAGPLTPLIAGYHEDFSSVWSPVGGWVAYHSHRSKHPVAGYYSPDATDDIWLRRTGVPAHDSTEIQLTDFGFEAGSPSWSRDGSRIVFSSWETGGPARAAHPYYVRIDKATGRPLERGGYRFRRRSRT